MKLPELIQKVKSLNLPDGSYVVYGSGPLAAAGIREASDIDLLVTPEVFADLQRQGWQIHNKGLNDNPLMKDDFDIHKSWSFSDYAPTLEHLLKSATVIEGVPFASPEEVRKWKAANPTNKSKRDIELIDSYIGEKKTSL